MMGDYTVMGAWMDGEPVAVGVIAGIHAVTKGDRAPSPGGMWIESVRAAGPGQAQTRAIRKMRRAGRPVTTGTAGELAAAAQRVIDCWEAGDLAAAVNDLAAVVTGVEGELEPVYVITRGQVEAAAGGAVTSEDLARVAAAIPNSTIPEALGTIVEGCGITWDIILLCDGCYQAVTGLPAVCEDGCHQGLDHTGLCLRRSGQACQWCGRPDRLREMDRDEVEGQLPTVGEENEGQWFLHWLRERQGPYPSAQAAWDDWHATGEPTSQAATVPGGPATQGTPARPASGDKEPGCADHGVPPHRRDSDGEPSH
jgi:hypothetical protein